MVRQIDSYAEFKEIVNSGKVVVIDFWATWCGPCIMAAPEFEAISKELGSDSLEFIKVDVDVNQQAMQEAGIQAMPTFQVWKNGKKISEVRGFGGKAALKSFIDDAIAKAA